MKIVLEEPLGEEEDKIIFRCRTMTPELLHVIALLKTQEGLVAYENNKIYRIRPAAIYYIEVVDNKTFLYCKDKFYESKQKLYEIEEQLLHSDLLRVSRSVLLNLSKVKALSPALNGRFAAELENGETLIISRQYVSALKKRLGV